MAQPAPPARSRSCGPYCRAGRGRSEPSGFSCAHLCVLTVVGNPSPGHDLEPAFRRFAEFDAVIFATIQTFNTDCRDWPSLAQRINFHERTLAQMISARVHVGISSHRAGPTGLGLQALLPRLTSYVPPPVINK